MWVFVFNKEIDAFGFCKSYGHKDISKLEKKTIVDIKGHTRTVYVNPNKENKNGIKTKKEYNDRSMEKKTIESIYDYLSKTLESWGFELELNSSNLSDSKYITISNWTDVSGKESQFNDEKLKIRISDHDLPPSYDGKNGYHDIDIFVKNHRPGNDGKAMAYYDVITNIAGVIGKPIPIHVKNVIENIEKKEQEQKQRKENYQEKMNTTSLRDRFQDLNKDVVTNTYEVLKKYVFSKFPEETELLKERYKECEALTGDKKKKMKKKVNEELKVFAEGKKLLDLPFEELL